MRFGFKQLILKYLEQKHFPMQYVYIVDYQ